MAPRGSRYRGSTDSESSERGASCWLSESALDLVARPKVSLKRQKFKVASIAHSSKSHDHIESEQTSHL